MKIAVPYNANGQIFQHFGHTQQLKIYDIENDKITNSKVVATGQNGHGGMAAFLNTLGIDALICGGIGGPAKKALAEAGITFYPYAQGAADEAVQACLNGNLAFDMNKTCSHHNDAEHTHDAGCAHDHSGGCSSHATCGKHD